MDAKDPVWSDWHPVAVVSDVHENRPYETQLLGVSISFCKHGSAYEVTRVDGGPCRITERYATLWVALTATPPDFFALPEFAETDRRVVSAGSIRLNVSGLRAVENFLDMSHFPFVHTDILGAEPQTEVLPYDVSVDPLTGEILATNCRFVQPRGSAIAPGSIETLYIYRVARPYITMLYKNSHSAPERLDALCLFIQPVNEDWCIAHTVMVYVDDISSDQQLRHFQQTIFGQDLMILVNQVPRRLPLDATQENPVRADKMSSAYRRMLRDRHVRYGTYSAAAN